MLFKISGYHLKLLQSEDDAILQALLEKCADYSLLVTGSPPALLQQPHSWQTIRKVDRYTGTQVITPSVYLYMLLVSKTFLCVLCELGG